MDLAKRERLSRQGAGEVGREELVDIRDVVIDRNLPASERLARYLEQIGNPYRFRVGDVVVQLDFAGDGRTLVEALESYLRALRED